MKHYWKEVASIFELGLNEEFKIKDKDNYIFKFCKDGLFESNFMKKRREEVEWKWELSSFNILYNLLCGKCFVYTIINYSDTYWYFIRDRDSNGELKIKFTTVSDNKFSIYDIKRYSIGNCYKNATQARLSLSYWDRESMKNFIEE